MNEEEFNRGVEVIKGKKLPDCPSNLEANVLRRVRLAKSDIEVDFLSWIGSLIPKTAFVMGALALVIATSSIVTYASTSAHAANIERKIETDRALNLGFVKSTELLEFNKH